MFTSPINTEFYRAGSHLLVIGVLEKENVNGTGKTGYFILKHPLLKNPDEEVTEKEKASITEELRHRAIHKNYDFFTTDETERDTVIKAYTKNFK